MIRDQAIERVREAQKVLRGVEDALDAEGPDGLISAYASAELLGARIEIEAAMEALSTDEPYAIRAALLAELRELITAAEAGRLNQEPPEIIRALGDRLRKLADLVEAIPPRD